MNDSEEAVKAQENESDADGVTANVDAIRSCQTISDFANNGTNSCYTGTKWTFELPIRGADLETSDFEIFELSAEGDRTDLDDFTISNVGATTIITFGSSKTFTASQSELNTTLSSSVNIQITNAAKTGCL